MCEFTPDTTPESLDLEQLALIARADSSLLLWHLAEQTTFDVQWIRLMLELGRREAERLATKPGATSSSAIQAANPDKPSSQEEEWVQCRAAFVKAIKEENFYRDVGRWSLKQHWAGPRDGFADTQLQARWHDFKLGWEVASKQKTKMSTTDNC